jgi:hypothetical protein
MPPLLGNWQKDRKTVLVNTYKTSKYHVYSFQKWKK